MVLQIRKLPISSSSQFNLLFELEHKRLSLIPQGQLLFQFYREPCEQNMPKIYETHVYNVRNIQ